MGTGYDLYVLPTNPRYAPSSTQMSLFMRYLADKLSLGEVFAMDDAEGLPAAEAVSRMSKAAGSTGSAECNAYFPEGNADALFGRNTDAADPDENYWASGLTIYLTTVPVTFADWEDQRVTCPACGAPADMEALVYDRESDAPIPCKCGTATPIEKLTATRGVRFARMAIAFTGNQGWRRPPMGDRAAFKDPAFLSALQRLLGTPLEVLAVPT